MRQVKGHHVIAQHFCRLLIWSRVSLKGPPCPRSQGFPPHRVPQTHDVRYLQRKVRPPLRADPALRSEADSQGNGTAGLAVPQGDRQLRHRHRKAQPLPGALLQQHPGWNEDKQMKITNMLLIRTAQSRARMLCYC